MPLLGPTVRLGAKLPLLLADRQISPAAYDGGLYSEATRRAPSKAVRRSRRDRVPVWHSLAKRSVEARCRAPVRGWATAKMTRARSG